MLHHTAVSYDKNPDQFAANNRYHENKWHVAGSLGFYLGYNYEIAKNGRVRQARTDGEVTLACSQKRMNDGRCVHICLDGNFDLEEPAPEQIYALRDLLLDLVRKYKLKAENIVFHNQYAKKTCPGKNIHLDFIRTLV